MERELIGILLICLVASTVAVFIFFGEQAENRIEILKVDYPESGEIRADKKFGLNVMARKDVQSLKVQYSYLRYIPQIEVKELYQTEGFNESVRSDENTLEYLVIPEGTREFREALPTDVGFLTQTGKEPLEYRKGLQIKETEVSIRFYDYSEMLRWVPPSSYPDVFRATTQFAFVSIPEGNISVLKGCSDFYINREESLTEVEVGKDANSTAYYNPEIREVPPNSNHVNEAPPFGTIEYGELKKGERAYLSFITRDLASPGIQVIRFWVNGELLEDETRFNLIGNPVHLRR